MPAYELRRAHEIGLEVGHGGGARCQEVGGSNVTDALVGRIESPLTTAHASALRLRVPPRVMFAQERRKYDERRSMLLQRQEQREYARMSMNIQR